MHENQALRGMQGPRSCSQGGAVTATVLLLLQLQRMVLGVGGVGVVLGVWVWCSLGGMHRPATDDVEVLGVEGRGLGVWRRRGPPLLLRMSVLAEAGDLMMTCVAAAGVDGYPPWRWERGAEIGRGTFVGDADAGDVGVNPGAYSLRRSVSSVHMAVSSPRTIDVRRLLPSHNSPKRACRMHRVTRHTSHVTRHTSHITHHTSHVTWNTHSALSTLANFAASVRGRMTMEGMVMLSSSSASLQRTLHVTRHTSHVTRHTSHVTRHTSHVTRHTSHVTLHTSHVTRHTSHITRHTSHVTCRARSRHETTRARQAQRGWGLWTWPPDFAAALKQ